MVSSSERLRRRALAVVLGAAVAACLGPVAEATAADRTGGQSADEAPATTGGASANLAYRDILLIPPRATYVGKPVTLRGAAILGGRHRITIQMLARGRWTSIAHVVANRSGAFAARWTPASEGRYRVRALLGGRARRASESSRRVSTPQWVSVFRTAIATWYGPGFYGNETACGIRLTTSTLGVAHRTLPCGTRVQFFYGKRSITVPVIDRGPYANNADWDLTTATAHALGITGTVRIAAMPLH